VVIFLAIEAASMPERLGVIRETRPHIADGLETSPPEFETTGSSPPCSASSSRSST
jgi:hypothetical protein